MKYKLIIGILVVILIGNGLYLHYFKKDLPITPSQTGSTSGWQTYSDSKITFKYPSNLGTVYEHPVDWPPKAQILDSAFSCTEAGNETMQAGVTTKVEINNHEYCLTKESEGAAGSTYTNYAYAHEIDNKEVILTFSMQYPQCENYGDPQKPTQRTDCLNERSNFDLNQLMDTIFSTVKLNAQSPVETITSGISGIVYLGPICPVEKTPPDPKCADKPYATTLTAFTTTGKAVKKFTSDTTGKFKVSLLPGNYYIKGDDGVLPRCGDQSVITVKKDIFVNKNVLCDTGIR